MRIFDVEQGTREWLQARIGVPTASELDALVSPTWKLRTGQTPSSYVARKLAERWVGHPLHSWSGGALEQGSILEGEALPWLEFELGISFRRIGFVTTDAGDFGCSPDGWCEATGSGVEIKCPEVHTHTKWLLAGELPAEHAAQVQGSMYATGAKSWRFLSYCRRMPPLILDVARDEEAQDAIRTAVEWFGKAFGEGWRTLIERNGGSEPKADTTGTIEDEVF